MAPSDNNITGRKPIPCQRFSTEGLPDGEQFGAWKDFSSAIIEPGTGTDPKKGFRASGEFRPLGTMTLASFDIAPMKFHSTSNCIRKSSFDHWCLAAVSKGQIAVEGERNGFRAAAGSIALHSYAQPFTGEIQASAYSAIVFSRDEFWDVADELDQFSHRQLAGPMSLVLSDFLVAVEARAKDLTLMEAAAVNEAFGHLLRALAKSTSDTKERAKPLIAAAQFERARRYINENLRCPELTPDAICKALSISRRQLFYLFERYEGVTRYIRHRRLAACYNVLTKSSQKQLISSVAYQFGYTNLSSFTRQFQKRYGFSPSETHSAWLEGTRFPTSESSKLIDWLLHNSGT